MCEICDEEDRLRMEEDERSVDPIYETVSMPRDDFERIYFGFSRQFGKEKMQQVEEERLKKIKYNEISELLKGRLSVMSKKMTLIDFCNMILERVKLDPELAESPVIAKEEYEGVFCKLEGFGWSDDYKAWVVHTRYQDNPLS